MFFLPEQNWEIWWGYVEEDKFYVVPGSIKWYSHSVWLLFYWKCVYCSFWFRKPFSKERINPTIQERWNPTVKLLTGWVCQNKIWKEKHLILTKWTELKSTKIIFECHVFSASWFEFWTKIVAIVSQCWTFSNIIRHAKIFLKIEIYFPLKFAWTRQVIVVRYSC